MGLAWEWMQRMPVASDVFIPRATNNNNIGKGSAWWNMCLSLRRPSQSDAVENAVGDHNLPDFLQVVECRGNLGILERFVTHAVVDATFNGRQRHPAKKEHEWRDKNGKSPRIVGQGWDKNGRARM